MPPKPGYLTTEFWMSFITQALGFAVLLGFIQVNDSRTLEEALGKAVAAVFTLLASGKVAIDYIRHRTLVKVNGEKKTDHHQTPTLFLFLAALLTTGLLTDPAPAQVLPWRQQINERLRFQERLLQELISQRSAPQPQPPFLILPIPGAPKQELPIGGDPKQLLPIPGNPRQEPPIEGEPRQPLPPGGEPKQELPLPPPNGPQRLSIERVLAPLWIPVPLKEKR